MNKSPQTSPLAPRPTIPLANGHSAITPPTLPTRSGGKRHGAKKKHRGGASLLLSAASALEALTTNRLRSLLTTLGIIIGVGAVIVMISISQGTSAATTSRLSTLGPNVLTIIPGAQRVGAVNQGAGSRQTLTQDDADAIASQVNNVAAVSPIINVRGQIIFQNQNYQSTVQGVYPGYQQIGNWTMAEGAFFTDSDESSSNTVAVVGQTVVQNLFTPLGVDPVGQQIRISGQTFTVVGVLATKGANGLGNADDVVYIPFDTAIQRLTNQRFVSQIAVQASSADAVNQVQADIQSLLEQRHNIASGGTDDFSIRNQNQILQTVQGVATTLTFLLVGVAAVSLVVGGIGIMNIMLVSVTERTREIGIRMAVGARRRDILSQFLIEAIFLSGVGGLIGIGVGVIVALQLSRLGNLPELISFFSVLLAFGVSALVGVLFGLYPAWRASRLDPITALRVE
ncbi:MAG TPA: ABC transporter permease [Ktedonobacterales bacterium]|nr:ABC transporter permease [Ktedonobacterales bacterium]